MFAVHNNRKCLAVVFTPLIKRELDEFVSLWNEHKIRQSTGDCLGGIPNDMYQMPQHYGILLCHIYL